MTPTASTTLTAGQPTLVSGDAQAGDVVTISDNSVPYATVTADDSDNFATQVTLTAGDHTLGVTSTDGCGNVTTGAGVTVNVKTPPSPPSSTNSSSAVPATTTPAPQSSTPPTVPSLPLGTNTPPATAKLALTITKPRPEATTTETSVYLEGVTTKPATETISVNGTKVAQSQIAQTSFGFSVPLRVGTNAITVTATSGSEKVTKSLGLTRVAQHTWYATTAGKVVIGGTSLVVVLLIVLIIMVII